MPSISASILEGKLNQVAAKAQGLLDDLHGNRADSRQVDLALLTGDLMLALDRGEEAEAIYRLAIKGAAQDERGQVRVVSCRTTGMLSLFQGRFGTALSCFRRIGEDSAADATQKIEALCGHALADHGMGMTVRAAETIRHAGELAVREGSDSSRLMVDVLRAELLTRQELLGNAVLRDHVFWQQPHDHAIGELQSPPALEAIDAGLKRHSHHRLVAERLGQLRALLNAVGGNDRAFKELQDRIHWLCCMGLTRGERQTRVETALAAIIVGNVETARSVLEPMGTRAGETASTRLSVELSYCLAKVCELTGHHDESLKHYHHYAQESMRCVRAESGHAPRVSAEAPTQRAVKDEVEMGLPARYRRAYRYLIDHLASPTLSVREISEVVGVSERALQLIFKNHLGMTPVELVQRCRVERIRDELLNGDAAGRTVSQSAERWGIRNRSTLVSVYRKHFNETPMQTLSACRRPGASAPSGQLDEFRTA